jgi:monothiol glutaredoxin
MNLDENIKKQIEQLIQENDVFLFMKGNPDFPMCGFSSVASAILKNAVWSLDIAMFLKTKKSERVLKLFQIGPLFRSFISKRNS